MSFFTHLSFVEKYPIVWEKNEIHYKRQFQRECYQMFIWLMWHHNYSTLEKVIPKLLMNIINDDNMVHCVTTITLGSQLKQGVARLRAKRETQESLHMLPGVQRVWGNEPSHSQVNLGVGVPNGLPNLQSMIIGVKTHRLDKFSISLESYWRLDV